ncbi:hypothetical protein VTN00DRAFT_8651 [Thermoascus crustaceus]|uniref:uncharacterized protein n=1 Tax=Thermoascus crustaceus TaxID=5088 RepID=UPI00374287DD
MVSPVAIKLGWTLPFVATTVAAAASTNWYAPNATAINNLDKVMNSSGVYGFIFNSSKTPEHLYGQYNWCNMPHVRKSEYVRAPKEYELVYIEVIQRHHKRTPYQSNTFPVEGYAWNCDDAALLYYGEPISGHESTSTFWKRYETALNPFQVSGFNGTCSFPQITSEGLQDSWQHGHDIYEVYHNLLHFLPEYLDNEQTVFRVTTNVITSQVAGMLIEGMYGQKNSVPLLVQRDGIDSLEPAYSCPAADNLFSRAQSQPNSTWVAHLDRSQSLYRELDAISGVPSDDSAWHGSFDHYFDNLSARLCHNKPLPCNINDPSKCVTQEQADKVFRLGQFEYSYMYRDAPTSLAASTADFGVWIGELAQHFRDQMAGKDGKIRYRHNVAHDGSLSRLLSILQIDVMVWPGMGSEVIFELYKKRGDRRGDPQFFVRVLWGGRIMRSSNPDLGVLNMIPVDTLLTYFDALVGQKAQLVPGLCKV